MDEAENCDRVAVIDHGQIVALDTPDALKSAVGGDLITITTQDGRGAANDLRRQFGLAPRVADGTVSFQVPAGEAFLPELVRSLDQPLEAISLRRPTLDDVFLHLTGHEIRDEGRGEAAMAMSGRGWRR
jgi:ABC-2 type transport system ATP-binding protein